MRRNPSRRELLAGSAVGLAAGLAGCVGGAVGGDVSETERYTEDADDATELTVSLPNGRIEVVGEDRDDAEIVAETEADSEGSLDLVDVSVERAGDRLSVVVDQQRRLLPFGSDPLVSLSVRVPRDLPSVTVDGVNGRISVADLDGDAVVDTTNGEVSVRDVAGDVTVDATNGRVEVADDEGDVTATTTNGEIVVRRSPPLDARIDAETTNGSVEVSGFDAVGSRSGGGVSLTAGDGTDRIDLETTNGRIEVRPR